MTTAASKDGSHNRKASLDTLPIELIAYIAISGDFVSLLSLSRTSRFIRDVVYNHAVIKDQLLTNLAMHTVIQDERDGELITRPDVLLNLPALVGRAGTDTKTWARFALAQQDWVESTASKVYWITELALYGYPIVDHQFFRDSVHHILTTTFEGGPPANALELAFCAVLCTLPRPMEYTLHYRTARLSTFSVRIYDHFQSLALVRYQIEALQSVVDLSYNEHRTSLEIPLPSLSRIPLISPNYRDLPVPFSKACGIEEDSWRAWYVKRCAVLHQSSAEVLFSGEWRGYYSYRDRFGDPPTVNIRFEQLTAAPEGWDTPGLPEGSTPPIWFRVRDALDGRGHFSLVGDVKMDPERGLVHVHARKTYQHGVEWMWNAVLTPFGIVGHWSSTSGNELPHSCPGSIWLWKKEWCDEQ